MINKNEIVNLFNSFNNLNVLIIGDVMIDSYYYGDVNRISPEAPVPIVSVTKKNNRLGGAANVALNIKALGANPILCSVIGQDSDSETFDELLKTEQLNTKGIIKSKERITTVKTRVIGNNHQVIRVDSEVDTPLSVNENTALLKAIITLINNQKIDIVIFQDYDKGVITKELIEEVITICNDKNIPTTVDPKKKNFANYKNATLFKPNLKELKEGLNIEIDPSNVKEVEAAIDQLNSSQHNKINFITLSEYGVLIKDNSTLKQISAHVRDIADVSGAGDTVISVASLCLALNQPIDVIAEIANLAGGLVCESVGVVPIDKDQLRSEVIANLN
ncbi:MAG: D-glycero-beta-D-manno-heptose-7-phosphate kinase [Flavobacteriales bacterium]|nr:MAG: D-glycero-beta-D-manno-heptose-7-phosphate kinase [Flavobacteriales bacterium]